MARRAIKLQCQLFKPLTKSNRKHHHPTIDNQTCESIKYKYTGVYIGVKLIARGVNVMAACRSCLVHTPNATLRVMG